LAIPIARKLSYTVTAALTVVLVACNADTPTALPTFSFSPPLLAVSLTAEDSLIGARRRVPLLRDVTASAVIDRRGGSIRVSGTGFTLRVPPGAVKVRTMFKITALAGTIVAYEFQPHGARFAIPLGFSQSTWHLVGGSAGASPLLGYFSDRTQLNHSAGTAKAVEAWQAQENDDLTGDNEDSGRRIEGSIPHFSGYMVSSGRTATTITR
jgi:hypothetical protein